MILLLTRRNNILPATVPARLFDCGIGEPHVHESSCGYQPTRQPDNVASRSSEEFAAVTLFSCFQQSLRNARTRCCNDDCVSDIKLSILNALTFAVCGLWQCRLTGQSECTNSHVSDRHHLKQMLSMVPRYFVSSLLFLNPFNVIFAQRANLIIRLFI